MGRTYGPATRSLSRATSLIHYPFASRTKLPKPSIPCRPSLEAGASPVRLILLRIEPMESPRPPPALTDDLLEEILLRVASPADLARASAACASFRRLIADPSFVRRYRSLHPPLLLGFLDALLEGFQPAEAPHPNAPAARALASDAGFSFEYLPPGRWGLWDVCGVRDGRVLLRSAPEDYSRRVFPDLVVCDPVHRRYLPLPPIPDDLLASVQVQEQNHRCFEPLLAPSAEDEDETSFKVSVLMHCATETVVFVFSRRSGHWIVGTSISWNVLSLISMAEHSEEIYYNAYGCFFWRTDCGNKLIKLDTNRMEFSTIDLPPGHDEEIIVVGEAGDDRLGIFCHTINETIGYYTATQNVDQSANDWRMEGVIPMPAQYSCYLEGGAEGCIFLRGVTNVPDMVHIACFSLEIKTLKIERVSRLPYFYFYPYFGFPRFLSPRRI